VDRVQSLQVNFKLRLQVVQGDMFLPESVVLQARGKDLVALLGRVQVDRVVMFLQVLPVVGLVVVDLQVLG
jgi:hypothetical protein